MTGLFYARSNPYNFWVARKAVYFDTMEQAQDEAERLNADQAEVKRLREALEDIRHICGRAILPDLMECNRAVISSSIIAKNALAQEVEKP